MLRFELLELTDLGVQTFELGDLIGEQRLAGVELLGLSGETGVILLQDSPALGGLADVDNECFRTGIGVEQVALNRSTQSDWWACWEWMSTSNCPRSAQSDSVAGEPLM